MGRDVNDGLTVDQKIAKVLVNLRSLRPFYSALYESMERIPSDSVPTMGVTNTKMYYNEQFVKERDYGEFLFINLHEVAHVALMHTSRRESRDPQLWNIAADMYVNKLLSMEFNVLPGQKDNSSYVSMPKDGVFCSTIDLDVDSVESIYNDLEEQAKKNGYMSQIIYGDGGDKGDHGNNGNNSNNEKDSSNEDENSNGKKNKIKKKENNKLRDNSYEFTYEGSKNSSDDYSYYSSDASKYDKITIKVVPNDYCDIIVSSDDSMKQQNDNKRILSEAKVKCDMNKKAGDNPGLLELKVNKILASRIDWRRWLKKYCIASRSTDTSFSNPDKRMYYQNAIYPGQMMDESNMIKGIKICIDTSGSISDTDLQYIFGQVLKLTKQFKIEAEVIAWDTIMKSCGELNENTSLKGLDLYGGGGTDPSCLFEYFDSKQCKVKPVVVLVFTDGYWSMDNVGKWAKNYKNTLWVMTKGAKKDFEPPFGLKAEVRYDHNY